MFVAMALIDTHRLVTDLKTNFGFSEKQAEGVAVAIERIDLNNFATKADLRELKLELFGYVDKTRATTMMWVAQMMIGQVIAIAGVVAFLIKFMLPS